MAIQKNVSHEKILISRQIIIGLILQKMVLWAHKSTFLSSDFLAESIFSRVLRDSTPRYVSRLNSRSVGRLVGRLVSRSPFYFFGVFELFEHTALAQMP